MGWCARSTNSRGNALLGVGPSHRCCFIVLLRFRIPPALRGWRQVMVAETPIEATSSIPRGSGNEYSLLTTVQPFRFLRLTLIPIICCVTTPCQLYWASVGCPMSASTSQSLSHTHRGPMAAQTPPGRRDRRSDADLPLLGGYPIAEEYDKGGGVLWS